MWILFVGTAVLAEIVPRHHPVTHVDRWLLQYFTPEDRQVHHDTIDLICDLDRARSGVVEHGATPSLRNFMDNAPLCQLIYNEHTTWKAYDELLVYTTGLELRQLAVMVTSKELQRMHLIEPTKVAAIEGMVDSLFVVNLLTEPEYPVLYSCATTKELPRIDLCLP